MLSQFWIQWRYRHVHASSDLPTASAADTFVPPVDFDALFATHYRRVVSRIARIVADQARAEDLAIEAFWRLFRNPSAMNGAAEAWLHRTAINLALDELRRRARRARYEQLISFMRAPRTPDDLFSAAQEQGRVRAVLASLTRRQAALLVLRIDDLSYDDIARTLSISPASVGALIARAKTAFRKEYVKRYGHR